MAYSSGLPYAAQTYAGVGERVISVAWLRTEGDSGNYRGMMAIPAELSLKKEGEQYKICFHLPKEFYEYRKTCTEFQDNEKCLEEKLSGIPAELDLSWGETREGSAEITIGATRFWIDFSNGKIEISNPETGAETVKISFEQKKPLNLDFVIDQQVIEFYGNDGIIYGAVETEENVLKQKINITSDPKIEAARMYRLWK